ncbi:MAG: hypothetical protein SCK70_04475 [bacterium]|nr:hypothetical protein [bacterium]
MTLKLTKFKVHGYVAKTPHSTFYKNNKLFIITLCSVTNQYFKLLFLINYRLAIYLVVMTLVNFLLIKYD